MRGEGRRVQHAGHRRAAASAARCRPGRHLGRPPLGRPVGAARWLWRLDARTAVGPAMMHSEGCPLPTERVQPLGTLQALGVLTRPGATACTVCDAAEAPSYGPWPWTGGRGGA
ncbi:DUF6233 domain-containing protein [Streptomyces sp. NRRL F-4428]|uniref:DUF6233 domain-containing protein n=1 Tax=Streptomyces sp. NRRL F-4428 TaxID=1609137 RepID=UPI003B6376E9